MQFYEAHYLKLLFFLPLLLVLGGLSAQLWRRRLQKLGYEPVVTEKLIPGFRRAEAGIRLFLLFLVFTCIILALARPQWGESAKKVERKGVDLVFLLDTSLSMLAEDIKPNRFETAKHEIKSVLRKLKGDRVGLVVFSGSAYLQTPLTLDYSAFLLFLESVKVGHVPDAGSSLSSALNFVLRIFPKEDLKYKVLILMTEGEDTLGGIDQSIKALADAKIRVYAIGMGTEAGGPIPLKDKTGRQVGFKKDRSGSVVISRMDPSALKKIASETGGLFLPSTTAGKEIDLLLKHISSLEQKNLNEKMISQKEDHYGFFLFWAFIFLILEMFVRRSQRIKPALMLGLAFMLFSGFLETPRGLNKQGNEDFVQKKYQSAIEDYRKAKIKAPEDGSIRYNLGTALYQTNQYKDARQEFQKSVELSKQTPDLQAKAYYNLGNTEYRLGNFEGAIKNYKEALKLNPKDTDAKSNLEFVQKQKSLFDKKNDEQKKNNPQQDQPQNQQQNKQDQNQDQQNQDQKQQNQQDQSQQNQDSKNQQGNQDSSQQKQNDGGQGEGSGQQDSNSQQNESPDQGKKDSKDQPSEGQGEKNKPENEPSLDKPPKSDSEKNEEKPGEKDEASQQEEEKPAEQDPREQGKQEKEKSAEEGQQEPKEKQPSEKPEPSESGENLESQSETSDSHEEEPGGEVQENSPDILPGDEESGEESEAETGADQDAQKGQEGQEKEGSSGAGTQYQGQMSLENALKILDALHEGEKEFSDLRRPASHRQSAPIEKDW